MSATRPDTMRNLHTLPISFARRTDTDDVRLAEFSGPPAGKRESQWWLVPVSAVLTSLAWWFSLDVAVSQKIKDAKHEAYQQGMRDSDAGWAASVQDAFQAGRREGAMPPAGP